MKRLIQLAVAAFLITAPAYAVNRYSCDFENEADRTRWVINPTANQSIANQIKNKWYLGDPGNNDRAGQYGLYISDNGGLTAHYSNVGCWNYAYDTIALDHLASGDYTIIFDYCAMSNEESHFDGLYLLWIPMTKENGQAIKVLSTPNGGSIPSGMDEYIIRLQPTANMDYLSGSPTWRQCAATIPNSLCDGTLHYLAFVWTNGSQVAKQPGAMIDNINIVVGAPCAQPTNLHVSQNGTTLALSWAGTASQYEVSAYSYDGKMWLGPTVVTGNTATFSGLPMGQADFIVRAICDDNNYSLKTITDTLVYYPDELCVDYLTLSNAKCYINNSNPGDASNFNDFLLVPAVDKGSTNIESRHTVHYDRTETDVNTGGMALTVPEGEFASVRLGNWKTGNEAERIEFTFDVDTIKYPVLLLKYLPILEAPSYHSATEQARFTLDILVNGHSIGECGQADFNCLDVLQGTELKPGAANQGWHIYTESSTDIVWKEWTTVGVNLKKYANNASTITARLTTFDCTQGGHFGYAYFTLGCSDGKFKDMKCGQINPEFKAPDGFSYRWAYAYNERYRRPDGSLPEQYIVSRSQNFNAGMHDDSLYVVDCMFVQDSTCYFSLYASTLATNPVPMMKKPQVIRSCRDSIYQVKFDASPSWVQEIDHVTGDTLVSKAYHIETYEWHVEGLPNSWSYEVSPTYNFPLEGGDYRVSLRTTCGSCDSTIYYDLHMEPLGPTHEVRTIALCDEDRKNGFVWSENQKIGRDTLYHTYTTDSVVLLNPVSSCDSVIVLQLVEPVRVMVDTLLLPDSLPATLYGRTYGVGTKTLIDTIPFPSAACDSTWVLNLEIYESIIVNPVTSYVLCEGEGDSLLLVWDITRGRSQAVLYSFNHSAEDTLIGSERVKGHYEQLIYVGALQPNVYQGTLHFVDRKPEFSVSRDFTLTVNYSSSVIAQRWNDVLAIRNADYNGGYQFDSVQWYVGGQPIEGATDFNYYTGGNGVTLRFGEEYTALLTRNDGVKLFTCPFIPTAVAADVTDMPSLVPPAASLHINGKGTASWYDMLGRLHHTDLYDHSDIVAPASAGYYLLVLQTGEARTIQPVMVK